MDRAVAEYRTGSGVTLWKAQIATGNGDTFRKQGFPSKAEAVEWAKLMFEKRALSRGQIVRPSTVSFSCYAAQWLQDKRDQGVRQQTLMRYEDELRLRVLPYFGRTKLDTLTKSHLVGFLRQLRSTGLSSTSTNFSGQLFKSIVKQAELEDAMPSSGIHNVPLPKKERPTPIFWTGNEIERFLALTASHPNHDLWTFALFTGCAQVKLRVSSRIVFTSIEFQAATRASSKFGEASSKRLCNLLRQPRTATEESLAI
jgi:site-specific recombinase XerD